MTTTPTGTSGTPSGTPHLPPTVSPVGNPLPPGIAAAISPIASAAESASLAGRVSIPEEQQWKTLFSELINFSFDKIKSNKKNSVLTNWFLYFAENSLKEGAQKIANAIFINLANKDLENGVKRPLGQQFVANLLTLCDKYFKYITPDSDINIIKEHFKGLIYELLEIAFPDKENDKNLPSILQELLKGNGIGYIGTKGKVLSALKEHIDPEIEKLSDFNWDYLIEFLTKHPIQIYTTSYKAIKDVNEDALKPYEGVKQLSDDITKLAITKVRGLQKLPLKLDAMKLSDNSNLLLNTVFVEFLTPNSTTDIVDDSWKWIENTFQSAISKVLLTIFKPKSDQTVEVRYFEFVDSLSKKAVDQIPGWNEKVPYFGNLNIEEATAEQLAQHLSDSKLFKEGSADEKAAKELLKKNNDEKGWVEKARKLSLKVLLSHLSQHLNKPKLLESSGTFFEEELKELLKKKQDNDWIVDAKALALKICYYEFAQDLLKDELNAEKFKGLLPGLGNILPDEYIISLLYDQAGSYIREFHEHHQSITKQAAKCQVKLEEWKIPDSDRLIDEALEKLTSLIEDKANKKTLLEKYEFLNKIVCHLLKKTENQDGVTPSAQIKGQTISFVRDAIKIIAVTEIEKKMKDGMTAEDGFKEIIEELVDNCRGAIKSIEKNAEQHIISDEEDRKKFDEVLQKIHECIQKSPEAPLFEIKHLIPFDWTLGEASKKALLDIFAFSDELPPDENDRKSEVDQRIFDKVTEDAFDLAKSEPSFDDFKKKLLTSWLIKKEAKGILNTVLPKKDADVLIPKTLQNIGIWDLVCDAVLSPYVDVIYYNKSHGSYQELDAPNLKPLIDKYLPILKKKLRRFKTDNKMVDGFLGKILGKGGKIDALFDDAVLPLINSIMAYHVNEKEGQTSEERTATLFWNILTSISNSHERIVSLANAATPEKISEIIKEGSEHLANIVIPQDLWNRHVPDESNAPLKRKDFVDLIEKFLIGAQDHFAHLQNLTKESEANLDKKAKQLGITSFIKSQVDSILKWPKDEPAPVETEPSPYKWLENVKDRVLEINSLDPKKPLNWFIEAFVYGIADFLVLSKMNDTSAGTEAETPVDLLQNLEDKFKSVAAMARRKFDLMGEPQKGLSPDIEDAITPEERKKFIESMLKKQFDPTTAQQLLEENYFDLVYWVTAKKAVDTIVTEEEWNAIVFPKETDENKDIIGLMKTILTKDLVAGLLSPILKETYILRNNLEERSLAVERQLPEKDKTFIEEQIITNLRDKIESLGEKELKSLPPFLRTLMIKLFTTGKGETTDINAIKNLRERLVGQIVYVVWGQLVDLSNPESAEKINNLINELVTTYQITNDPEAAKANDLALATKLFEVVPQTFWNQYLTGLLGTLITREKIIDMIVPFVSEIRESIKILAANKTGKKGAEAFFQKNEKHEVNKMLEKGIVKINAMIDAIGDGTQEIAADQPKVIQNMIKGGCHSDITKPVIKKAVRDLLYVVVHHLLKDNKNELSQEKVLDLFGKVVEFMGSKDPEAITKLLKDLIPKSLLETYLPPFLQETITHENIVKWFLEGQLDEIEAIKTMVANYEVKDESTGRLQTWVKGVLTTQFQNNDIFEGTILQGAEKKLLKATLLDPTVGKYADLIVDQIVGLEGTKKFLKPEFLGFVLNQSLTDTKDVVLPAGDFGSQAANKILGMMIVPPVGLDAITAIPKAAREAAFDQAKEGVAKVVNKISNRNERVVFLTGMLAPQKNEFRAKALKKLESQIDPKNAANFKEATLLNDSKKLFKMNVVSFAKQKVDDYVDGKNWNWFIKGIARFFVKLVVTIAMHISIKHRLWNFFSNAANDEFIKKMLWKFICSAESYTVESVTGKELGDTFKSTLDTYPLLPFNWLRKLAANAIGEYVAGNPKGPKGEPAVPPKSIIDILAGPAVVPPKTTV